MPPEGFMRRALSHGVGNHAEATADPMDVGIDRQRRPTHGEAEDDGRGLGADPGQAHQLSTGFVVGHPIQVLEVRSAPLIDEMPYHAKDEAGFGSGEAARADRLLDRGGRGIQQVRPVGKRLPQVEPRTVRVRIGGVLRQDTGDQHIQARSRFHWVRYSMNRLQPGYQRLNPILAPHGASVRCPWSVILQQCAQIHREERVTERT